MAHGEGGGALANRRGTVPSVGLRTARAAVVHRCAGNGSSTALRLPIQATAALGVGRLDHRDRHGRVVGQQARRFVVRPFRCRFGDPASPLDAPVAGWSIQGGFEVRAMSRPGGPLRAGASLRKTLCVPSHRHLPGLPLRWPAHEPEHFQAKLVDNHRTRRRPRPWGTVTPPPASASGSSSSWNPTSSWGGSAPVWSLSGASLAPLWRVSGRYQQTVAKPSATASAAKRSGIRSTFTGDDDEHSRR